MPHWHGFQVMSDHQHGLVFPSTDWLERPVVRDVFRALDCAGHETRIVGGAVRNALLGLDVADIDMATTLTPEHVMRLGEEAGLHAMATGIDHGTVTLISHGEPIEVTTLRADVETDGRHAKVQFGRDWAGDAARRDFTINALYCSASGEIFDPLGGAEDLVRRHIRFVGDPEKRIGEDYLRILRFFRFYGAYGEGPVDEPGLQACIRMRSGLDGLSRERIWSEFAKILTLDRSVAVIKLMFDFGLLVNIVKTTPKLKKFTALAGVEKQFRLPKDAIRRLGALALFSSCDGQGLGDRFRLSRREVRRLERIAACFPQLTELKDAKRARAMIYWSGRQAFEDCYLLALSSTGVESASR